MSFNLYYLYLLILNDLEVKQSTQNLTTIQYLKWRKLWIVRKTCILKKILIMTYIVQLIAWAQNCILCVVIHKYKRLASFNHLNFNSLILIIFFENFTRMIELHNWNLLKKTIYIKQAENTHSLLGYHDAFDTL